MKWGVLNYLTITVVLFACVKEVERTTVTTSPGQTTTTGSTSGGTTTSGTTSTTSTTTGSTSGGTGSTCYGTTADGNGQGNFDLFIRDITLAGNKDGNNPNWTPVYYDSTNQYHNTPVPDGLQPYSDAQLLVNSVDATLKVRVKILSQPTSCAFKKAGAESVPYYTKLRFKIRMYALIPDPNIPGKFNMTPTTYTYTPQNPVAVNGCSEIFTIPYKQTIQPAYANPVVIGIEDVRSDFECQRYGNIAGQAVNCPAERLVREQSCWRMRLQVATDATDGFN